MSSPYLSLQHDEAVARRQLLTIDSYDVRLDLTGGDAGDQATFGSVATIRFRSAGGSTFLDLKPVAINSIRLDGVALDPDQLARGRFPLETSSGDHELIVDAVMPFRNDGEGLHRSVDPADGRHYVYGMCFMDAAPTVFACFDQPDLKAPYSVSVRAPQDWTVVANAPKVSSEPGAEGSTLWEFEQTRPLATYFVTVVAGPYHVIRDAHDGIPLGLSARASIADALEADAEELFTITKQCFDEFHRLFGIRYPFGDYHQAFVPEFNAGAMENPGCVTFRDPLVFASRVTRGRRIQRATTIAHEMAHQWFGNIVTPSWWDDLWLNESFAEYMGNRVTADVTEYDDAWTHNAYARRQWGLVADQRPTTHSVAGNGAVDATAALQDFDGISYTKGSSILKQLNTMLGDDVFFAGVIDHLESHRFGNATMHDLFTSWERAGAGDLTSFTSNWLRTAGPDAILLDRAAGALRRTPPTDHPADRAHVVRVAQAAPEGKWEVTSVSIEQEHTPYVVREGAAVLLDPFEDSWALVRPDSTTVGALKSLLPRTDDPLLRAGVWNNVRSGFHNVAIDPADVLDLIEVGLPVEDSDDALFYTMPWVIAQVVPAAADPVDALARVHRTSLTKAHTAAAASTLQLAAFQAAVASASDPELLRAWLGRRDLPPGLEVDLDARWELLVRLATLGQTDRSELRAMLDAEPTARSRVEHTRATASLPDAEAKRWAWRHFAGEVDVPNYELEAAGLGMWRRGQEDLLEEYVDRYFAEVPGTVHIRSGWVLADTAQWFFPAIFENESTLGKAQALLRSDGFDPSMHRRVADQVDELERRIAIRRAFPRL